MSRQIVISYDEVASDSYKAVRRVIDVDDTRWDDIVDSFQDVLREAGYIFASDFNMKEILNDAFEEDRLAYTEPTSDQFMGFAVGMEDEWPNSGYCKHCKGECRE